jgi:16S rRNA (cytosine1402-N4)-methyltransferase
MARRIARAIVGERKIKNIETTTELARIILSVIPKKLHGHRLHPATKTFQALRIAVNKELSSLQTALTDGIDRLHTGGRFSVISYHSLEDRMVKTSFRSYEKACICPHDIPICNCQRQSKARVVYRRPVTPSDTEISDNPRARSAKLRTAERI